MIGSKPVATGSIRTLEKVGKPEPAAEGPLLRKVPASTIRIAARRSRNLPPVRNYVI
ncbi:hypothetical protein Srufu_079220 (plasmid) [Streptomyces libani subsp. rufus]|nr:hypothetical protein Srufu_079220 [Streptomyces libani subsp. rufus]